MLNPHIFSLTELSLFSSKTMISKDKTVINDRRKFFVNNHNVTGFQKNNRIASLEIFL